MKPIHLSVLFSDIKGYTGLSKKLEPQVLKELLDSYLQCMSEIIEANEGTIDKVMGDGIIALFGAPNPVETHELKSVRAAVAMQAAVNELADNWQAKGGNLIIRIGIASGDVIAGDLEVGDHEAFTALGDEVNLASRLEAKAKPGTILVSASTHSAIASVAHSNAVKNLELKGFPDAVTAYEILALNESDDGNGGTAGWTAGMGSPDEMRISPRKSLSIDVTFIGAKGLQTESSVNISEGGIFIKTDDAEPMGAKLRIAAQFPSERGILPLVLHGQVVRHATLAEPPGMGIKFLSIQADKLETIYYFASAVYSLTGKEQTKAEPRGDGFVLVLDTPEEFVKLRDVTLSVSMERVSSGDMRYFEKRLLHEFDRTRRYSHEFSCVAVRVYHLEKLEGAGLIEEVLIEVADLLSASVRSTDEVFYFRDGQFFILAPETMQNRVSTLTLRIIESVHQLIVHDSRLSELDVKAGSFSFDGQNADRPQDILKFALSRCSD